MLRASGPTLAAATSSDSAAGAVIKPAATMVSGEINVGIN